MFFSNEVQIQSNQTHWLCGSYVRLSKEDIDAIKGGKDESNSVTNQKAMIRSYLEEHPELELYEEYVDDGYTGVNFDRPDFKRLMEDVKVILIPGDSRVIPNSLSCPLRTCLTTPIAVIFLLKYAPTLPSSARMDNLSAALPAMGISRTRRTIISW